MNIKDTWLRNDEALGILIKEYQNSNFDFSDIDFWIGARTIVIGFCELDIRTWNEHLNLRSTQFGGISNKLVNAYYTLRGGVDIIKSEIRAKYIPRDIGPISDSAVYSYVQRKIKTLFNTKRNGKITQTLVLKLLAHRGCNPKEISTVFGEDFYNEVYAFYKHNDELVTFMSALKIQFPNEMKPFYTGSGLVRPPEVSLRISESRKRCYNASPCLKKPYRRIIVSESSEDDSHDDEENVDNGKKPVKASKFLSENNENGKQYEACEKLSHTNESRASSSKSQNVSDSIFKVPTEADEILSEIDQSSLISDDDENSESAASEESEDDCKIKSDTDSVRGFLDDEAEESEDESDEESQGESEEESGESDSIIITDDEEQD